MFTGASYPETKRLYELTIGLATAVIALACSKTPAINCIAVSDNCVSESASKKTFSLPLNRDMLQCIPEPLIP